MYSLITRDINAYIFSTFRIDFIRVVRLGMYKYKCCSDNVTRVFLRLALVPSDQPGADDANDPVGFA